MLLWSKKSGTNNQQSRAQQGSSTARAVKNARTCWASAEEEEGHKEAGTKHQAPQIDAIPEGAERGAWDKDWDDCCSPSDQVARLAALNSAGIIDNDQYLKAKARVMAELQ